MEKICRNCKYFKEYYVKIDCKFMALNKGHCIRKISKERKPEESCLLWQEKDPQLQEKIIKNKLLIMAQNIEKIAEILLNVE